MQFWNKSQPANRNPTTDTDFNEAQMTGVANRGVSLRVAAGVAVV